MASSQKKERGYFQNDKPRRNKNESGGVSYRSTHRKKLPAPPQSIITASRLFGENLRSNKFLFLEMLLRRELGEEIEKPRVVILGPGSGEEIPVYKAKYKGPTYAFDILTPFSQDQKMKEMAIRLISMVDAYGVCLFSGSDGDYRNFNQARNLIGPKATHPIDLLLCRAPRIMESIIADPEVISINFNYDILNALVPWIRDVRETGGISFFTFYTMQEAELLSKALRQNGIEHAPPVLNDLVVPELKAEYIRGETVIPHGMDYCYMKI